MFPFVPSLLLLLLLAAPALLTPSTSQELQVRGQRTQRDTKEDSIKVVISEGCSNHGDSSDGSQGGKEIDLTAGSPLVLTHKIKLVPSTSGSGSGSCGCDADFAALRERLERLEREVSALREKCGAEGGCCTSKESKGAGCSIKPEINECPNECSDQGRCVDGKCVCFPGFSGPDCSESNCPGNCNNNGKCVNGQCVCDPGFTGPDCLQRGCPDNCNNRGRCVNGKCVCNSGFTGPSCSDESCPGNCNNRGRCVNGQCVCNPGFTGPDCSKRACANNCNDRGRCVNGKCVCDSGFTGADCSENSCPGNCNNRGRCINGQCVCNPGFTGPDCAQRACPDNCNNRGRCVNGKCVCDSGFTGADCSETACPANCNNKGRCINGECVCEDGFGGPDCSEILCPNDCYDRGRCVDGKCECDAGFTGDDCSEESCPGNCNNRGKCVDGKCVCNDGFTGEDCSEKTCPNNCSNRGKCVNGKCVCDVGFAGPDCAAKGCPNNCNNKGRCVKGRCVCRRGFTGPDCSQCEEGMTGPNCDTVMSGVSQLSTRDITETSVTLVWTPPPVQYDTYHITFTSQKESDQQITVQVEGSLTTFTQTGLAAGQEYTVSVTGEIHGRKGTTSTAEFMTLISGPTNLHVVKTTSTSAVVQWEQSQGEIDRYRLTVTPSNGEGRSQEMTVPAGQNSAQIQQLEAGRLYDITLVAEKGSSRSEPATTQVTPGETLPRATMAALTAVTSGQEDGERVQVEGLNQQKREDDESSTDPVKVEGSNEPSKDSSATVIARTKPPVKTATDGTRPKPADRPPLSRKPNVLRSNVPRVVPAGKRFGPGPLKKPPAGEKKNKVPIVPKKPKPGVPTISGSTIALTVRDPSVDESLRSTERGDDKDPAITSGTDSETNTQSSSEDPTVAVGTKEQPDVGMAGHGNDTVPVSLAPTGTVQSQEKKCMNKVKVTHIRLPHMGRGSGCRADGTVPEEKTPGLPQSSSETDVSPDLKPSSAETDLDYPDPLHKLLKDTFNKLNVTTFSVHLSKPTNLFADADRVTKQILVGLKPLSSITSSSQSSSSSSSESSAAHSSPPSYSTSSSGSSSLISSSLTAAPSSLTHLIPLSPSSSSPSPPLLPPSSSPLSTSDNSGSVGNNEPDVDKSKIQTDVASAEEENPRKPPLSGKGGGPFFRRTPGKPGYVRRPRPNIGPFRNKTNVNVRVLHHSPHLLNPIPGRETESRHTSTSDLSSTPSSSTSEESSSVELNVPVKDTNGNKNGETTPASSGVEESNKKLPTERRRVLLPRPPPKGGYPRRPLTNFGSLQNQTRPISRLLPPPSRPLVSETSKDQGSSAELLASTSPPASKVSHPFDDTEPVGVGSEDKVVTSVPSKLNQTLRGGPSSHRPTTKVGYFRRTQQLDGRFPNKNYTNLRVSQHPHRVPMHKPFPPRKVNGGNDLTAGNQISLLERDSIPQIPDNQSGEQGAPTPTKRSQIKQTEEQDVAEVIPSAGIDGRDTTIKPPTNDLEGEDTSPILTARSGEEEISPPDTKSDLNINKERSSSVESTDPTSQDGPTIKQTPSDSRKVAPRPVTPPKRQPPSRRISQHQMRHYTSGSQREGSPKTNNTTKRLFDRKPQSSDSKALKASNVSTSGNTREPLDYVGVTNRTSDGFTLTWDSPEGKYKNFVVTKEEVGKIEAQNQRDRKKYPKEEQEDSRNEGQDEDDEAQRQRTKQTESDSSNDENTVPENGLTQEPRIQSSTTVKPLTGSDKIFKEVVPGSARSFQFENLPPQTEYTVTLLGKSPGLLSRLHKLVISTGPEPPTNIIFSKVTENSLTVSWTKPKSPISGFKVTYTHTEDGEPVSVSVGSEDSSLGLSKLSPGSSYEVNVISILGLDESDPIRDSVMTLPDPPTDLRAVNITDSKALLLWRPALATVDEYTIVYGSGTGSELRVTVSGNAAEQQLSGLEGSTTYTVTITSQLGGLESSPATTTFTTTGGSGRDGDGPRDLQASNVSPRTALLSWKPPSNPVGSYRLTYQTEGQEMKEVTVDASVTEYSLTRLHPGSKYTVQLQAESGGRYTAAISTDFTTGTLRFPFPTDCSEELLNGIKMSGEVEIFPQGKTGTPLMVYCDMETDGGGWTVFQRRKDGSVDFFRTWREYIRGFGDLSGEFWLGLESIHNLTAMTKMNLRVDLRAGDESAFAKYSTFEVARRNYRLTVGGYSGTAGDSLSYHNNRIFTTKDRDPATFITRCAMSYRGGWWYKNCHEANLNGRYGIEVKHQGVIWTSWKGKEFSIPFTEMKMRPEAFRPPSRG